MWEVEAEIEKAVKKHGEKYRVLIVDSLHFLKDLEKRVKGVSYNPGKYVDEIISHTFAKGSGK